MGYKSWFISVFCAERMSKIAIRGQKVREQFPRMVLSKTLLIFLHLTVCSDSSKKSSTNKYPPPPPSSAPQITASLSQTSLRTILLLGFTSPPFRALLADSISLTREYVASKREGDREGVEEVREQAEQLRKESGVKLIEVYSAVSCLQVMKVLTSITLCR